MQFISASLGVECEFCHDERDKDKDDKKTKKTAREMIRMVLAINQNSFSWSARSHLQYLSSRRDSSGSHSSGSRGGPKACNHRS